MVRSITATLCFWYEFVLGFLLLRWNTMTKNWEEEGLFGLYLLHHCCSSLEEVRTGTQIGQDPRSRRWCRSHRGELHTGLLNLPSYRTRNQPPMDGTNHYGLGPPPLITKWENTLQLDVIKTLPRLRLYSSFCQVEIKSRPSTPLTAWWK